MLPKSGIVRPLRLAAHEKWILVRMLAQEKGIAFEEARTCFDRLAGQRARLRGMVDADVVAERYRSQFLRAPAKIGVFAKRHVAERHVETVDGVEDLREQKQVGG